MPDEQTTGNQRTVRTRQRKDTSGPIVVILIIATIIFFATNEAQNAGNRQVTGDSSFSSYAFLGGVETRNNSPSFRGGSASAVMGGAKLDFRDAEIEGDQATIEVSAIMGGVELHVPRTWQVVNHVVPVLGAVEDHTDRRDTNKRLIVEGTVLMGGLEIRN